MAPLPYGKEFLYTFTSYPPVEKKKEGFPPFLYKKK